MLRQHVNLCVRTEQLELGDQGLRLEAVKAKRNVDLIEFLPKNKDKLARPAREMIYARHMR
jgi:hypothetical protein